VDRITRVEALGRIPEKNNQVRETRQESHEILLEYPAAVRPWLVGIAHRLRLHPKGGRPIIRKLQLDQLGTDVWELLDGNRSVNQVIRAFARKHRLHQKEAEVSVVQFLRELGRRGLIGMR
jgi:hypothetical protein